MSSYTSSSLTLRAVLKSAAGRLGMGVPARRITGLTPAANVDGDRRGRGQDARASWSCRPTPHVERMTMDARFFLAALEGLSDAEVERAVLPFPSQEVDPYRGLKPHFDITSARARALHAIAAGHARIVIASAAVAAAAAESTRSAAAHRARPQARTGHSADGARRRAGGGRIHAPGSGRRIRRVLRSRRRRRLLSRRRGYSRSGSSSSATRSNRFAPTIPRRSDRPWSWIRRRSCRCRNCPAIPTISTAPRPSPTTSRRPSRRCSSSSPTRSTPRAARCATRWTPATRRRSRKDSARRRRPNCCWSGTPSPSWLSGATALESLALADTDAVHIACQPSLEYSGRVPEWVEEIRRGRERGDTMVFIAHSAGRAERTIELLADYDIFAVAAEGANDGHAAAVVVGVGHLTPRLPPAGGAASALGRDRRLRGRAEGARAPPLCHPHVPVGLPRSEGRRPRRPRRPRHRPVRRPQADRGRPRSPGVHGAPLRRARTSSSSRSSGSTWCRSTAAPTARRSIASAARRGKRRRRASRRRCATWPRSC